jgi:hypothetical protein
VKSFAYESPLELPDDVELDPHVIELNGMPFQKRSDCNYQSDYYLTIENIMKVRAYSKEMREKYPLWNEANICRQLILDDLWAFVYFVMKNPLANHPFIVEACKEIQATKGDSLQVWARDHLKSTIITVGKSCQKILNDPERRIGFFSATRPLALAFQKMARNIFETPFLIKCFPDILYEDPYKDAEKWSEAVDGGLIVKREGVYKEPTISSWGLTEGMPTGFHFTDMEYDDIVTKDLVGNPDIMQKVKENFDVSQNMDSRQCQSTVTGTFYHHDDPLVYIRNKVDPMTGIPLFPMNKKPATVDGSLNGTSVFLPERVLAKKRASNLHFFTTQQLLDPTVKGTEKLNPDHLIMVEKKLIPKNLYKFMLMDAAGDKGKRVDNRSSDAWAMGVIGVEPYRDDQGASDIYILDLIISPMPIDEAMTAAVEMYMRNGRILKLGVEKNGMSTTEIHLASALRAKKRFVSEEAGNLEILKPGGRPKEYRIESALSWPLKNGKIHISDAIHLGTVERLKLEMEKFPFFHDDGIDMMSYLYDILKVYKFGARPVEETKEDAYARAERRSRERAKAMGWLAA